MPSFLFFGDTERSPAMRHELPVGIGDPFVLAVIDGKLHVVASDLERSRIEATVPGATVHGVLELGLFELLDQGMRHPEIHLDHEAIAARRRVKTEAEMAGIRRAQAAAEAGMRAAAEILRRTAVKGDG